MPWGNGGTLNVDGQAGSSGNGAMIGYFDNIDANNTYRIKAGVARQGRAASSGYFTHKGDVAELTANTTYEEGAIAPGAERFRGPYCDARGRGDASGEQHGWNANDG